MIGVLCTLEYCKNKKTNGRNTLLVDSDLKVAKVMIEHILPGSKYMLQRIINMI